MSLFDDTFDLAEYVYDHHEKWGEQIPLISRVIAVTETYDRVLKTGDLPLEDRKLKALIIIKQGAGTQFDPQPVGLTRVDGATVGIAPYIIRRNWQANIVAD